MADTVVFQSATLATPPAATVVATDDVGGAHYQRFKLDVGADGASDPVVGTVPVSGTVTITGVATAANQSTQITAEQAILAKIIAAPATEAKQDTQITAEQAILAKIIAAPSTEAKQDAGNVLTGAVNETAPATDTANSGVNGRLQRIAQRLTSLIALLPVALGAGGGLKIDGSGTPVPVTGNVASGAADSGNPVKVAGKYNSAAPTLTDGQRGDMQLDVNANTKMREQYAPVYEDNVIGVAIVEHRYSYSRKTADGQVKATAGFIHSVSIAPQVAIPTAGLLTIYDSAAESGTVVYSEWVFAATPGHSVILDVVCGTGIYVGYDATLASVAVTVAYR